MFVRKIFHGLKIDPNFDQGYGIYFSVLRRKNEDIEDVRAILARHATAVLTGNADDEIMCS